MDVLRLLLAHHSAAEPGVCVHSLIDAHGRSAIEWAARRGHSACFKELFDCARPPPPLLQSCHVFGARSGCKGVLKHALRAGACATDPSGDFFALHEAVRNGHVDAVRFLASAGADANAIDGGGFSALMVAAQHDSPSCARCLLDSGADPTILQPVTGRTPLHYAARGRGGDGVMAVLLRQQHGPLLAAAADEGGQTPMDCAINDRNWLCAALLLRARRQPQLTHKEWVHLHSIAEVPSGNDALGAFERLHQDNGQPCFSLLSPLAPVALPSLPSADE